MIILDNLCSQQAVAHSERELLTPIFLQDSQILKVDQTLLTKQSDVFLTPQWEQYVPF